MSDEKLFSWQNINNFVRGIIEPHVLALRKRHDSYVVFNDKRHTEFKAWTESEINRLDVRITTEINTLRTWTTNKFNTLENKLFDTEGYLNYGIIPVTQLVEVGTIVAWPVAKAMASNKYLECNGQAIPSGSQYYELKNVLSSDRVPDYRGVFLRGYGNVSTSHYGSVTHSSGSLGTIQGDAIRNITGTCLIMYYGNGNSSGCLYMSGGWQDSLPPDWANDYTEMVGTININASRVVPISNENRPVNTAVKWYIRAIAE